MTEAELFERLSLDESNALTAPQQHSGTTQADVFEQRELREAIDLAAR
jgi:hypothetical protein